MGYDWYDDYVMWESMMADDHDKVVRYEGRVRTIERVLQRLRAHATYLIETADAAEHMGLVELSNSLAHGSQEINRAIQDILRLEE